MGNVTKTFLTADLDERVREMATRWSRAAARPSSTASMTSSASADADESDDEDHVDALSNESGGG